MDLDAEEDTAMTTEAYKAAFAALNPQHTLEGFVPINPQRSR
jgi:hypothetical protein